MKKRLMALCLVTTMILSIVSGCGKDKEKENVEDAATNFVYVGQYESIAELGENEYMNTATMQGEDLYYMVSAYDEATEETTSKICKTPLTGGDVVEIPVTLMEDGYLQEFCVREDGSIVLLIAKYNQQTYEAIYYIQVMDSTGQEKFTKELSADVLVNSSNVYINQLCADKEGNIYASDGEDTIYCFGKDNGDVLFTVNMTYAYAMTAYDDGVYAIGYSPDYKPCMSKVSTKNQNIEKTYESLPSSVASLEVGPDGTLFVNTGSNLYRWNEEKEEIELIMNWLDSDIDGSAVQSFSVGEGDQLVILINNAPDDEPAKLEKAILTKKEVSKDEAKTVISLSVYSLDDSMKRQIMSFNRTNADYKIKVKEYSDYEYEEAKTKMLTDLTGKDAPDIVDFTILDFQKLANQGYLADLNPYFNQNYNMADYQENVLKSFELDGKLYAIPSSFTIITTIAKTKNVQGQTEWDLKSFTEFIKNRPAGTDVFGYTSKEDMLRILLAFDSTEFINWKTGECSFNTQNFKDILELCNEFPETSEYNEDDESYPTKIQNDSMILFTADVSSVTDLQLYTKMAEEDITFVGFPVNGTCAPIILNNGATLGITAKSKNLDGAWSFLESILSDEYQDNISYGMPIKKSSQEVRYKEDMTPEYYTDENGNQVEDSKMSYGWDDWTAEIYAATEEEVARCRELVDAATGCYSDNEELYNMILEEVTAYFKGQKTVDEVAEIIQSRISLYVTENQ